MGRRIRLSAPKIAIRMQPTTTATGFDNATFVSVMARVQPRCLADPSL
jgi:hypothetical protein